jgi:hypothetical protein
MWAALFLKRVMKLLLIYTVLLASGMLIFILAAGLYFFIS